jgi:hypothetical protein
MACEDHCALPRRERGMAALSAQHRGSTGTFWTSSSILWASAAFLPNGFSHATPTSLPLPVSMAATISSMISMRVKLGAQIHRASMDGSATISVTELNTFASPTPSSFARAAACCAVSLRRLTTPSMSESRTPTHERTWNFPTNPPPMSPTPSLCFPILNVAFLSSHLVVHVSSH